MKLFNQFYENAYFTLCATFCFYLKGNFDCRIHTLLTAGAGLKDYFIQIFVVFFWQPFFFSFQLSFLLSLLLWPQLFLVLLSLWQLFVFVYPCTFFFLLETYFLPFLFPFAFFHLFLKAFFFFFFVQFLPLLAYFLHALSRRSCPPEETR